MNCAICPYCGWHEFKTYTRYVSSLVTLQQTDTHLVPPRLLWDEVEPYLSYFDLRSERDEQDLVRCEVYHPYMFAICVRCKRVVADRTSLPNGNWKPWRDYGEER